MNLIGPSLNRPLHQFQLAESFFFGSFRGRAHSLIRKKSSLFMIYRTVALSLLLLKVTLKLQ